MEEQAFRPPRPQRAWTVAGKMPKGWYSPLRMADDQAPREYRTGSDPRTLRDALGCFATGVTVVTCFDAEDRPFGLTANSFTSVSLDPPLLLVNVHKHAACAEALSEAEHFAINVLQTGQ
jgi:flavin reductase (DIM6/NTAB) family NADH-FMN oxidoreductase RutF